MLFVSDRHQHPEHGHDSRQWQARRSHEDVEKQSPNHLSGKDNHPFITLQLNPGIDPDAAVRQWAVEGMRYLGNQEALDELFESFTQDPSDKVRERAGCNISDCGNFTRWQRMRMVPKFLELVSDSSTGAQMRTWSFIALREITDVNLPDDPQVWNKWYRQYGAGKLAELERLDWWRVRGDE